MPRRPMFLRSLAEIPILATLSLHLIFPGLGIPNCSAEPAWHDEGSFRWANLNVPPRGKTGFRLLLPNETGIYFTNTLDERTGEANRVLSNGSGVAVGDFDNDGLPDLYFCSLNGKNAL